MLVLLQLLLMLLDGGVLLSLLLVNLAGLLAEILLLIWRAHLLLIDHGLLSWLHGRSLGGNQLLLVQLLLLLHGELIGCLLLLLVLHLLYLLLLQVLLRLLVVIAHDSNEKCTGRVGAFGMWFKRRVSM